MRLLLLCEGDAETWDSWSGTSRSFVDAMRSRGHHVIPGDADLYGLRRLAVAVASFRPSKRRWWVRYHLGKQGFRARSAAANRIVGYHRGRYDAILQFGATFIPEMPPDTPFFLYCDANIELSMLGARTGVTEASHLTSRDLAGIRDRERLVYRRADRIFTMSEFLRRTFLDHFDVEPERVITVHGGPNLGVRAGGRVPALDASGPPTILFVGRAFERKGGPLLLEAFSRVTEAIPEARLRIIGPDRPTGSAVRGVDWLGFVDKDHPPHRSVLHEAYRTASVFCLPTRFEPFGVVFLEAMSYGLPCVGPRAWAVPEIIADGETGLLFEPDDAGSLAEALIRLLRDPATGRAMGEAGHRRVREHFTWERVAERIAKGMPGGGERSPHRSGSGGSG